MVECIFTIDYEIYGNGEGSLQSLVYEPAEKLRALFNKWGSCFMPFVEVAELEVIEQGGKDPAIAYVKQQVRDFHREGFEIGLHIHPQWYRAQQLNGIWQLDYNEYNLCTLPRERIEQLLDRATDYLRTVIGDPDFTPVSFRSGNGLFQPSEIVARFLANKGIKIDSSVFKGQVEHNHGMDYRDSLKNGYCWRFMHDANVPNPKGELIEIPTYTVLVPFWKMITRKRIEYQRQIPSPFRSLRQKLNRYRDFFRFRYPRKFDFCRMTYEEMTSMMEKVIRDDLRNPMEYKPMVAIGHTKELADVVSIEMFLSYLHDRKINITTFSKVLTRFQLSV